MTNHFEVNMDEYLPLRDVVFKTLRQAILKGALEPGERLMEIQLAERLGVSRTPIREAIRKLELEGLVLMIPRKGAVVAEITVTDLEDVLEVRMALEELAVKLACRKITEEQLNAMRQREEIFRKSLYGDDVAACAQADMEFHDAIYAATGNSRLVQILNNLREQMYRYRLEYLKDTHSHEKLDGEHQAIYENIKNGDKEAVCAMVGQHIDNQKIAILAAIRENEKKKAEKA